MFWKPNHIQACITGIFFALFSPISVFLYRSPFGIDRANVPVKLKLQHPPPPGAYPGHLTVHRARGGGNLNVALEGWGI